VTAIELRVLSHGDCERIHGAALHVLQTVGVVVADDETRDIMARAGARVEGDETVLVPPGLVEEALATAPKKCELAGSNGRRLTIPDASTHFMANVKLPKQQGYPPVGQATPTREEIVNNCRLANALPLVEGIFVLDGPTADIPDDLNWLLMPAMVATATPRHVLSAPINLQSARFWAETMEAAAPSGDLRRDPLLTIEVSPYGPLRLDGDTAQVALFALRKGIPLMVLPMPISGAAAPMTLAGTLVVDVAEFLFMLTLAQVVSPGAITICGLCALTFNMHSAAVSFGDPEASLYAGAELAMSHYYGLPNYRATCMTDSYFPDIQAGIEKTLSTFVSIASGADLALVAGPLGVCTILSYEQIVIDHDIFEFARRVAQGIDVNEETLALGVIESIGHNSGDYMTHDHTLRWLRSTERYFGGSFNRRPRMEERETMLARAHQRVHEILSQRDTEEVPPAVADRVRAYVRDQHIELPDWL
jgi:trimethylamine--corrinoid protein Co-methyltransferase